MTTFIQLVIMLELIILGLFLFVSDGFASCPNGRLHEIGKVNACLCDNGFVCSGPKGQCHSSIHKHNLEPSFAFPATCSECECVPGVQPIITVNRCDDAEWAKTQPYTIIAGLSDQVSSCANRILDPHTMVLENIERMMGFDDGSKHVKQSMIDSAWSVLCRSEFGNTSKSRDDDRIFLWIHHKLHTNPLFKQLPSYTFNLTKAYTMTHQGKRTTALFVHELSSVHPMLVLQPANTLSQACDKLTYNRLKEPPFGSRTALVEAHAEQLSRDMPSAFQHVHYLSVLGMVEVLQGAHIKQSALASVLSKCNPTWTSSSARLIQDANSLPTLTVGFPVYSGHRKWLPDAFQYQRLSSSIPDQIVVAVSEATISLAADMLSALAVNNSLLGPRTSIAATMAPAWSGFNRNLAASQSHMRLMSFLDVDDVPHPQRNEVARIMWQHSNYAIGMFGFRYQKGPIAPHQCMRSKDDVVRNTIIHTHYQYRAVGATPHQGVPVIEQRFIRAVQYNESMARAADPAFDQALMSFACESKYHCGAFFKAPMYFYYTSHTSSKDLGIKFT
eukprot:TRINITY_DN11723_c0_g2_i1.p1 TRINITY_DN11723_c0_g2~~TRINITY_DN11723_c0_g2_i1.p1  ORF type:complete len:558 (+),score=55.29 TRINITY_DN11723_c0_g2_i1:241-1914(+)